MANIARDYYLDQQSPKCEKDAPKASRANAIRRHMNSVTVSEIYSPPRVIKLAETFIAPTISQIKLTAGVTVR